MDRTCETTFAVEDAQDRALLWRIYWEAFEDSRNRCAQEQSCYDERSFDAALLDPAYAKFVCRVDGDAAGMSLMTNDLEKARIAYVNPVRLRHEFPEAAREGRLWYNTGLAVRPDRQGENLSDLLFEAMTAFLCDRNGVLAFDFARDKHPQFPSYATRQFGKGLRRLGIAEADPPYRELGGQSYGAITFPKRP